MAIKNDGIPEICPLSESQKGIYFECISNPEAVTYNIGFILKLPKKTDSKRFCGALKTVMKSYPACNVVIETPDGVPSMVRRDFDIVIDEKNIEDIETENKSFTKPFDLQNGPLYRIELCDLCGEKIVFFDIHHIITDGTSLGNLVKNAVSVYNGGKIEEEQLTLFDVALKEQTPDKNACKKAREYFKKKYDGAELDLNPAPDVPCEKDGDSETVVVNLNGEVSAKEIADFINKNKITENSFVLGAFAYSLAKYSGLTESSFATAYHGRNDMRLKSAFGMFVKTLPVYCSFDEKTEVSEFLSRICDDFYQTKINSVIPFGELVREYGVNNDITFVFQSNLFDKIAIDDDSVRIELLSRRDIPSKADFMLMKDGDSYKVVAHFNHSVYSKEFISGFIDLYTTVLKEMLHKKTLSEISLVSKKARGIIDSINKTEYSYNDKTTVISLFRNQAKLHPENLCVVYNGKGYTYREVDEITERIAKYLVDNGIGKEKVVGILIKRCEYMVILSLAVLKAGGAYLPLDPTYPEERLNLMVKDSGAVMLFYSPEFADIINSEFTGKRISTDEVTSLSGSTELPELSPKDLFVMLYTSGSTGTPKGVMFEHGNTLVTAEWVKKYYGMDENSRVTSYASFGFDAHAFDIYPPLITGATVHIIGDEIRLDFIALKKYYDDNLITHTVMTTQVGRQFALMGEFKSLKHLSVAGEKLTPFDLPKGLRVYNLYGPTEGSVITSAFYIDKKYKDVPIGKPVDNLKVYITDKNGKLLPVGAVGELWIAGPHVTRGYLNRPEKNAESYGDNPFSNEKGYERIYKTGDIVRLNFDGNLQFIGRRDAQVKVRGFRVELTEVEEVIRRFNGIKDATVASFDDPSGGKFICAYIVSDEKISADELGDFIRNEKPPYMVPAVIMQIDKIPLNQNQKVNKKALPRPERKVENIIPPETDLQKQIFDIIAKVIGSNAFGIDNDLFDSGLTSIGAVKLNVELDKAFNVAIKNSDIKENNTVRKLEKFIENGKVAEEFKVYDDYPITETQKGIFVECTMSPNTVNYNIPVLLKLGEEVDTDKLIMAIKTAINAHPYAKATLFADKSGDIRAKRNDGLEPVVTKTVCEKLPDGSELVFPYELLNSPLYRISVYETKDGNYLYMDFHHIISDGTSEGILFADIDKAYKGLKLEKEKYTGYEKALDEEKARKTDALKNAKEYYDSVFSGTDSGIPPKSPESEEVGAKSFKKSGSVSPEKIMKFCSENKFTPNAFFVSAFGYALSRFTTFDDAVFTTVYNGRNDSRFASTFSMLVKTLPVMVKAGENKKVGELISETQKQLMSSMTNDIYSFAEISNAYGIKSDIIFVYQGDEFNFDSLCGEKAEFMSVSPAVAKSPISVNVNLVGDKYEYSVDYRKDIFGTQFTENFIEAFDKAVSEFTEREYLKEISLTTESSEKKLKDINGTERALLIEPINKMFERHAKETPDKVAVICDKRKLSYGELNKKANILARFLREKGVKKDTIVGLLLNRSVEVSLVEMGILKSGGAFLGLLPDYPDDRLEFCLTDSESPIVITTEKLKAEKKSLFDGKKSYSVYTLEEILDGRNGDNPNYEIPTDSLAYCIYTSGSTGKPKGVMIEHHNVCNCAQTDGFVYESMFGKKGGQVALSMASITFDMSIFDNLLLLLNGKTVCMATEEEIHAPDKLAKLLIENKVETIANTPSFLTNYITIPEFREAVKGIKTVVVGAEAFPASLYTELKKLSPEICVINGYGPTECTITCCAKELNSEKGVTIGGPTANTEFFVVDKNGNVLPPYGCGELIICGELVGRGYIKLPEKNKACFYNLRGKPAYHSGDMVRLNADGEVEFFGRMDNQVKLRGFRVELDEIEKTICSYGRIKQSKVLVRNNGSEDYLVGFFTAEEETDIKGLTEYLKSKLTYYMVPDAIMQLEKMPLTPSGKIDKKALPEIKKEKKQSGRRVPKKSLEEQICELFKEVLSLEEFYADDNFFEMGGTSLSASKAIMQLMSKGYKVEYQDVFDNPTPETLAEYIESHTVKKAETEDEKATEITGVNELLKYNTLEYAKEVVREPIGDVLLTGAVGFLGIHILRELIERKEGNITCLIRRGDAPTPEIRLKNMLMYYFGETYESEFGKHIFIAESDITEEGLGGALNGYKFDTIINCAACVKHYSADDAIEHINVHGVENLIKVAKERNAKLIQISTTSVPGVHTDDTYKRQVKMHENELFVIDSMDNKYCISKYHAELKMLDAIKDGMKGKIIRVGNLMGRHSDGEFQINFNTNAFLHALRGFSTIGKSPISHSTDPMSFSPIDLTAKAVVLLSGTNDMFTAFHANNRFGFDEMQLIEACNRCGINITPVDDKEYYADYYKMLGDEKINARLSGLVTNDRPDLHMVDTDNVFTANVLYRLGFSWPLIDSAYLERAITSLMTLDYFGYEEDDSEN